MLQESGRNFWSRFERSRLGLPIRRRLVAAAVLAIRSALAAGVPQFIAPTPLQVALRFAADKGLLWDNLLPTLYESVLGFFAGNIVAMSAGGSVRLQQAHQRAYFPVVLFLNTIPVLALAAIIVLIFGTGLLPKVIIASIICFFPDSGQCDAPCRIRRGQ